MSTEDCPPAGKALPSPAPLFGVNHISVRLFLLRWEEPRVGTGYEIRFPGAGYRNWVIKRAANSLLVLQLATARASNNKSATRNTVPFSKQSLSGC